MFGSGSHTRAAPTHDYGELMLHIVTINAGDYQGRGVEYTNILYDSVNRNLPPNTQAEFVVFTDCPGAYHPHIVVRPLPSTQVRDWWHKLSLFQSDLFPFGARLLYFDLSCVITGRLDALAAYDGPFATLRDFYYPTGLQSSIMAWRQGCYTDIWTQFVAQGYPQHDLGGDQVFIESLLGPTAIRLQDQFHDQFVSYKLHPELPSKASVVVFHGNPKPHTCTGWVPTVWKVGGLTQADLEAVCNTERETLLANITHAMTLPFPWFDMASTHHTRPICIVGGSPSLAQAIPALHRHRGTAEIWATNGAFHFLRAHNLVADVHVIMDARPINARFVTHPSLTTRYYIASHCDPSVFQALAGQNVTIFHCHIEGAHDLLKHELARPTHLLGGYTTVGMKAAQLADLLGARTILFYGMDSCYHGTDHHAYEQVQNNGEAVMDVLVSGRHFRAAPWMVGQAHDFQRFVMDFTGEVAVDGTGLLAHLAGSGLEISAAEKRAHAILQRLPDPNGAALAGAEIGVFAGDLSKRLLLRPDLHLLMVDSWAGAGKDYHGDSGDYHATLSQQEQDNFHEVTRTVTEFAGARARIVRQTSRDAAGHVTDESLDFVFIDADHSYHGAKDDIARWAAKVKVGGLIAGHDYENVGFPKFGVTQAVNEWANEMRAHLELGENFTWFIQKTEEMP